VPLIVAGQGVGAIAAWAATGSIEDHEAHKLAALRGAAVQLASLVHPSSRRASSSSGWNEIAMAPAREALSTAAAQVPRFRRQIAQVSVVTGAVLADEDGPDLGSELVEPISWKQVLTTLRRFAITDVVVLPPSRMLKNTLHDVLGDGVRVHSADDEAALDRLSESMPLVQAS
jgi:hypothetical protein